MEARWATVDDSAELVRLRQVMFDAMGVGDDASWQPRVLEQHRAGLADGRFFAAVVDAPTGAGLAGGAVGMVWELLGGPGNPGRLGYIQSMATDPEWRGRGVARSVLAHLLDGFRSRGVTRVSLHATAEGEPLYRSVGFAPPGRPELQLRLDG